MKVVGRCGEVVLSNGRWCGVCGPGQATDDGVVWVDRPAAAVLAKDGAMVLLDEVGSLFLFA